PLLCADAELLELLQYPFLSDLLQLVYDPYGLRLLFLGDPEGLHYRLEYRPAVEKQRVLRYAELLDGEQRRGDDLRVAVRLGTAHDVDIGLHELAVPQPLG